MRALEREIAELEARQKKLAAELEEESVYEQPGSPMQLNRELTGVTDLLRTPDPRMGNRRRSRCESRAAESSREADPRERSRDLRGVASPFDPPPVS